MTRDAHVSSHRLQNLARLAGLLVLAFSGAAGTAAAQARFNVLHAFPRPGGLSPEAALIVAPDGNFYGTTNGGGAGALGTVFKMTPAGTVTLLHEFAGAPNDGAYPRTALLFARDGNFYGTTSSGGISDYGTVFRMTPGGVVTVLHSFTDSPDGAYPEAPLIQATDGNFRGTTMFGGFGAGTVFSMTPAGAFTILHRFTSPDGLPTAPLVQAAGGSFYGTAYNSAFRITAAGGFTTLHTFGSPPDGSNPTGGLIQASDGNFYGTTRFGGVSDVGHTGTVFRMTPDGVVTILHAFSTSLSGGPDGANPSAGLVQGPDGNFYGTTADGGPADRGTVFRITPAGAVTILHAFTDLPDGTRPSAGLVRAGDGNFYGTTESGGGGSGGFPPYEDYGSGIVFRMTPAGDLTVIHAFTGGGEGGGRPRGALLQAADGDLYGAVSGGAFGGMAFKLGLTGAFTSLHSFYLVEGTHPYGALIQATDGNFYGTASAGGVIPHVLLDFGTVFRMTPGGATTPVSTLGVPSGATPYAPLLQAADGAFYGTTSARGVASQGTVFKITPAGAFEVLHAFTGAPADGAVSYSALIQTSDGNFYGTTSAGGVSGRGTAFTMTSAGGIRILHSFAGGADGAAPRAALVQGIDGSFYGTTSAGGPTDAGTVFRMTADGSVTILHAFTGGPIDGAIPQASLIQTADGRFYGTTSAGGASGSGTVFSMTASGTITVLHAFTGGADGANPYAALIQASDGNLYGTAEGGGAGAGVVFRVGLAPSPPRAPHLLDLNGDAGGDVFLYNRMTGERRFEMTNTATPGFNELISSWDSGWQIFPATLNHDEYTDLFLYDPERGLWAQARNHNDGTFVYTLGNWDRGWTVVPADLDGDGLTDLFVYNVATGVWVKSFVDGAGGFKGFAGGDWDPGWTFYTADLNGDGRDDFFLYNQVSGVWVEAFSRAGVDTFDYPASGRWDPGWQVIPADLDGNGRTDLFLLNAAGVHVSALSRSAGGFDYAGGPLWSPGWLATAGDLNHDGRIDLFLYNATTGVWVEAFSDGAGSFTYASGQFDAGWSVAMTDFNEDGRGDLLLSRPDGTWVQATNTGAATFTYAAGNWGTGWTIYTRRLGDR